MGLMKENMEEMVETKKTQEATFVAIADAWKKREYRKRRRGKSREIGRVLGLNMSMFYSNVCTVVDTRRVASVIDA